MHNVVNPIIEKLVVELLKEKPATGNSVLSFIKDWCDSKGIDVAQHIDA